MKSGYVRNPLTVIAIFAGLTEVGGTTVLPFLKDPSNQRIYIMFLIGFPIMLVHLFFRVLWYRHTNFYAPSDFSSDETFVKAQTAVLDRKWEQEVEDAAVVSASVEHGVHQSESSSEPSSSSEVIPAEPQTDVAPTPEAAPESSPGLSSPLDAASVHLRSGYKNHSQTLELRRRVFAAQEWAIQQLIAEEGGVYVRNVSPSGLSRVVFDAVKSDNNVLEVVEVKYNRTGQITRETHVAPLDAAMTYFSLLDEEARKRFRLVYIIVFDMIPLSLRLEVLQKIERYTYGLPFPVVFKTYEFSDQAQTYRVPS